MLDCRGNALSESGNAIIGRYNASHPGERFDARVSDFGPGLRMWLLEAGVRHEGTREPDGSWRLAIERRCTRAQGSIPGVHHVVGAGADSIWMAERASRVARIDVATGEVAAVATVARRASHLALDETRGRVFVADAQANEIIALRASDLAELARWNAPGMPQLPLVSAEGMVCVTGGATGTVTLAWPSGDAYRAQTYPVGAWPHDPCVDAEGAHVFVPCSGDGVVVKLRLADGAIVGRIPTGAGPSHLAMHPDGDRLYCANSWDGSVTACSTEGVRLAHSHSGGWAHAVDVSPDGRWAYVANFLEDTVAVFDATTLERVALLDTEAYPHGLDVAPDGAHLVVTGFCSERLRVIDAASHRLLGSVEVGLGSSHTVFAGGAAWVACSESDHVARVDLRSLTRTGIVRLPGGQAH